MPYIAIPGILFLRDIIVDIIEHYSLQTIIVLQQGITWSSLNTTFDQGSNTKHIAEERSSGPSVPQATVDVRSSPSYHRRPAVHLHGTGAPLHSLAIWIARDKAISTLKYSQTNTSVNTINYNQGVLSSRFICIKPIFVHKHLIKDSSYAN